IANRFDRLLADDGGGAPREGAPPQRGKILLEDDHTGVLAGDLDVIERGPVVLVRGIEGRVDDALEGILDVLRRQFAEAVAPEDPRAQCERDVRVIDLLDRLCRVRLPLPSSSRLEGDQSMEESNGQLF